MNDVEPMNHEGFVDAMVSAVLQANERELAEDAALAGEDLGVKSKQLRARFLERVALARARETGKAQTILAEAGPVLAAPRDYGETLAIIGDLVVRHIAEMCIVDMLVGDTASRGLTVAHADPTKVTACQVLTKHSIDPIRMIARSAIETRQPMTFDDIAMRLPESHARTEEHRRALRDLALRSAVVVPLLSGDGVLGTLVLASSRAQQFGPREIHLATELARRASLAILNVRRHEAEQSAIRARDEVLGIVAHDLRSPLHSINLAAQLLERRLGKTGDPRCQDYVSNIMQAVSRANRLIQDLLDVSRTEAGALRLAREVVETRQLVVEAVGSLQLLAAEASIELRVETDGELPPLWVDQARLLQVLENLIGNAIKFTPNGGCITVSASRDTDAVQFAVVDTGAGISEDSLAHVFDRFWQAESTSRGGAGLGLPICKGIIEAHGGRIWAESTLGCGARFFFTIPTAGATKTLRMGSSLHSGLVCDDADDPF